jgi:hypothetical protein
MVETMQRGSADASRILVSPRSASCLLLSACLVLGCAAKPPALRFATSNEPDGGPRRPPAVAVDPSFQLPPPTGQASVETGILVLQAPANIQAARGKVREFFQAVVAEDTELLDELLDEQAWVQDNTSGARQRARAFWRARLSRLEYEALAGQLIYRESEVETYLAEDALRLAELRRLKMAPEDDDVVLRVAIATPRIGSARLFGDEVVFLMRPSQKGYTIAEILEDFRLP